MNTYLLFGAALIPIVWLIAALGFLKIPAHKACLAALGGTLALALAGWRMPAAEAATSVLEGMALGVWPIMIVIVAAIFTYNLALHTGSMDVIKNMLSGISTDKRIQVLILAWGFGGFLEAVAGYGTAVAIPAAILAVLGFEPVFAAVICLIANTVPTAFGAVGIPVITLSKVTGLEVGQLSYMVALQLALFIVVIPFILVLMTTKSLKGLKDVWGITLASGISFALPQVFIARYVGPELPALLGSLLSMGTTILLAGRLKGGKRERKGLRITLSQALKAWAAYILIPVFIILTSPLFPPINEFLSHVRTSVTIYSGAGAKPFDFKWLTNAGTLIFLAAVAGGLIQGASFREMAGVLGQTLKKLWKSAVTVLSIVALAKVMGYSGMIASLAVVLVQATGGFFPFISPLIGALGTFITGSDTSSNVLFGALQQEVAGSIGTSPYWLAAANTAGATAGKMISPQSIAVATSATGLVGLEGRIFNQTVKFCIGYVLILGVLVLAGS